MKENELQQKIEEVARAFYAFQTNFSKSSVDERNKTKEALTQLEDRFLAVSSKLAVLEKKVERQMEYINNLAAQISKPKVLTKKGPKEPSIEDLPIVQLKESFFERFFK